MTIGSYTTIVIVPKLDYYFPIESGGTGWAPPSSVPTFQRDGCSVIKLATGLLVLFCFCLVDFSETSSHHVAQAGLELMIPLPK